MKKITLCLLVFSSLAFASDQPEGATRRRSQSILLVDDNIAQMAIVSKRLERLSLGEDSIGEIDVTKATNSAEATKAMSSKTYDLIITDFNMPGGNGDEVAKSNKRQGSSAPVVCCSANTDDELARIRQMTEDGQPLFDEVVNKTPRGFGAAVRKFIRKK